MAPGVGLLSDIAATERVVRVWTNDFAWYVNSFDAADVSPLRAMVFVRESTESSDCITSYPLRPRGTTFGVRPGQCSITVAVWSLDGVAPLLGDVKVFGSIGEGRPQRHDVAIQTVAIGATLWWQPDKFNGSYDTIAITRAGVRFADALRISWVSLGAVPNIRVVRGIAGPTVNLPVTAPWGSVDLTCDNILQIIPTAGEAIVSATALVYR